MGYCYGSYPLVILLEEEDAWDGDTESAVAGCIYNCRELHLICEINLINKFG